MQNSLSISFAIIGVLGTASIAAADPAAPQPTAPVASASEPHASGTAINRMTFFNRLAVAVNSGSLNFAGTVTPVAATVSANSSDAYTETGVGTVTSFHITYTAQSGGKACHFDAASFPSGSGCMFTKAAQSQGSTSATCTATLTSFDMATCSQTVTFSMQ